MARENEVVLRNVRLSYANIWRARSVNGGAEKYSCSTIISKNSKENVNNTNAAIKEAEKAGIAKFGASFKSGNKFHHPLFDGDAEKPHDEAYENCYYLNAKSDVQPIIVDKKVQLILDTTEVYSGCYANVTVSFFPFNNSGNKGIGCSLKAIQKIADGEPLGGGRGRAEDYFSVIDDDDDFLS